MNNQDGKRTTVLMQLHAAADAACNDYSEAVGSTLEWFIPELPDGPALFLEQLAQQEPSLFNAALLREVANKLDREAAMVDRILSNVGLKE